MARQDAGAGSGLMRASSRLSPAGSSVVLKAARSLRATRLNVPFEVGPGRAGDPCRLARN